MNERLSQQTKRPEERSPSPSKEQLEKMSSILDPILKDLADSSKESYAKARKAVGDALEEVNTADYSEYILLDQYFHRKITDILLDVIKRHMTVGVPGDPKFLPDFLNETLARKGMMPGSTGSKDGKKRK